METNPAPLDYRSPNDVPRRPVFSTAAFVAAAVVAVALLLVLLFLVPRFEGIFKSFGVKLPLATQVLISASRFAHRGAWIAIVVLPVAIGFLAALLERAEPAGPDAEETSKRRRRRRTWAFRLATFAIGVIMILTTIALFMPMISLIDAVSGK